MIITLVGYRGCGKSSVAPLLAARIGWDSVDADTEIERHAGRSIREIFSAQGESEFRRIEREVIAELLAGSALVLATGGGAVLNAETRRELRKAGPVVWLRASVNTILQRLQADSSTRERRPSLTNDDLRTEIDSLLSAREPLYRDVSTIVVQTDERTPPGIVDEIFAQLPSRASEEPA